MCPLTKQEVLVEIQNRGEIDTSNIISDVQYGKWFIYKTGVSYGESGKYSIYIEDLHYDNPPAREGDIHFWDAEYVALVSIDRLWVLSALDKLPFVGSIVLKTVYFISNPESETFTCTRIQEP